MAQEQTLSPPAAVTTSARSERAIFIRGMLLDTTDDSPVSGTTVTAFFAERHRERKNKGGGLPEEITSRALGCATTDANGRFTLAIDRGELPAWAASLLTCGEEAGIRLTVTIGRKNIILPRVYSADEFDQVVARVTLPRPRITRSTWRALAEQIGGGQTVALNRIAAAINTVDSGLDAATRQQLAREVEAAFLDPTAVLQRQTPLPRWSTLASPDGLTNFKRTLGDNLNEPAVMSAFMEMSEKVISFHDITQVDWDIPTAQLKQGNIGDAIIQIQNNYAKVPLPWDQLLIPHFVTDRELYRDYLVSVWAKISALNPYFQFQTPLTESNAYAQLVARFHQNFKTGDTSAQPANEIAIEIITTMLKAPAPTGKGLAANAIPVRGTLSAREYLDKLIALSGVSAHELGLRYRINLERPDSATSTRVDENIYTLQGFFRDSFQSERDPFHTPPDIRNDTMIPNWQQGRAPFYLQYEEWLDSIAPFYGENMLSPRRMLDPKWLRPAVEDTVKFDANKAWYDAALTIIDNINKAHVAFDQGEYKIALDIYQNSFSDVFSHIQKYPTWNSFDLQTPMAARAKRPVANKPDLLALEWFFHPYNMFEHTDVYTIDGWARGQCLMWLIQYAGHLYWLWAGDTLLAMGRLPEAIRYYQALLPFSSAAAQNDSPPGYFDYWNDGEAYLYHAGNLPYTIDRSEKGDGLWDPNMTDRMFQNNSWTWTGKMYETNPHNFGARLHKVEQAFIRLRLGNALLEWADALFRTDQTDSIARAREFYKGVLWLHGDDPGISPHWPKGDFSFEFPSFGKYKAKQRNPAIDSQLSRARLALLKIEAGLNYYGYTDDMVPTLRYRTLKDAADRFAALAKAAEHDFLSAMNALESLTVEQFKTSNLLTKASAQRDIATEQTEIAKFNVTLAQRQVTEVQAQIDAKRKELQDKDNFWNQLGDFASGLVKTFTGMPGGVTSGLGSALGTEMGGGDVATAGMLGLGAGATITAGFGLFWYAGYTSMSAMANAYNGLAGQIKQLETVALPLAEKTVVAKQREVKITELNRVIAEADIKLARDLLYYETNRFLNADFWGSVAGIMRRVMRRYLELGAWSAWLAERALAFEQARTIRIVRMDYLPRYLQGVTGADLLQLDLAEVEAARIAGTRLMVPFRHSYSLATDFPLAFGQLKLTGSCGFVTTEESLRNIYHGTFGHRIRAVQVQVRTLSAGRTLRGMLVNHGVSLATRSENLDTAPLVRFPDALPISEFSLDHATNTGTIPAETLLPFEGSGCETFWNLELDRDLAAAQWDQIVDVLISIEGRANFSEGLRQQLLTAPPPAMLHRHFMVSGNKYVTKEFAKLAVSAETVVTLPFDLTKIGLPAGEKNRKVRNLMVLLPGVNAGNIKMTLHLTLPAKNIAFDIEDGYALSNGEPLKMPGSITPDDKLNAAIGATIDQTMELIFNKTVNPAIDFASIIDVILAIEYEATP